MLRSYITAALRNLARQRGYSFINLLGLAIGIACCLVILLYIRDEFSHDRWLRNFAYRTAQPLLLFPAAGLLATSQALRAARADPAVSLRTE